MPKNNRLMWKVIIDFVLFFSILVEYARSMSYSSYIVLYAILEFLIVSLMMRIVPTIQYLKKGLMEYPQGKKLCIWNSVIGFCVSVIITVASGLGAGVGGIGAISFYFINMFTCVEPKWLYKMREENHIGENNQNDENEK